MVTGEKISFKAQGDCTQVLQPTWAAEPGRVPARLCGRAGGRSTPASPGHGCSPEEPQQAPERAAARLVRHTRSGAALAQPLNGTVTAPRAAGPCRTPGQGTEPGHTTLSPAGEALTRSLFTEPVTSSSFRCRLNLGGMAGPCRGAPCPGGEAWRREQGAPGRPRTGPAAPALTGPGRAGGKWLVPESPRHIEYAALRLPRRAPSYRWRGPGAGPRTGSGRGLTGDGRGQPGGGASLGRGGAALRRGWLEEGRGHPGGEAALRRGRGRGRRVRFKPRSRPRVSPVGLGPRPARPSVTSGTRPRPAAPGQCRCPRRHREGSGSPAPLPL